MVNIAILGYGTVGSGVVEVLNINRNIIDTNAEDKIRVKYVLDLRDFPNDPIQELIVHDYETILNDEDVKIVVEVMGGIDVPYDFVSRALKAGKHVCTSNKALVAAKGNELIELARKNNVSFLFEASCGGGIPVIRPLNNAMTADVINSVTGILNGTTNYILTKMAKEGIDFETVLKEAQELGYAEKDPSDDINGDDTRRKLAILSSIVYEHHVDYLDVYTEGITKITPEDIKYAEKMNRAIKLIAHSKIVENSVFALVAPFMLKSKNPLYSVNDVFNAILIHGNAVNDVMFYGSGAGKLPTASAVVSDIVDIVQNIDRHIELRWNTDKQDLLDINEFKTKRFIRFTGKYEEREEELKEAFGRIKPVILEDFDNEFAITTEKISEEFTKEKLSKLKGVLSHIRMF